MPVRKYSAGIGTSVPLFVPCDVDFTVLSVGALSHDGSLRLRISQGASA